MNTFTSVARLTLLSRKMMFAILAIVPLAKSRLDVQMFLHLPLWQKMHRLLMLWL